MSKPRVILQCPKCSLYFSHADFNDPKLALKMHLAVDHA